jgi:putative ABC transport system permease protein
MADGEAITGVVLLVADDARPSFYHALAERAGIASVSSRIDTIGQWRSTVASTMTVEMSFFLWLASAIAVGVAYNMGRVALADRARDLATLRVLGFDQLECAYILLGELMILALLAAPVGVLGGIGLAQALVVAFSHQDLKLPMTIRPSGYGESFATYLAALLVAGISVGRRVWRLDLVRVLKTRE